MTESVASAMADNHACVRKGTAGVPFDINLSERFGDRPRFGLTSGGYYDRRDQVCLTLVEDED